VTVTVMRIYDDICVFGLLPIDGIVVDGVAFNLSLSYVVVKGKLGIISSFDI